MKKLLMVILAVAMITSFLPKAEAGETANLGLSVTFDITHDINMWVIDADGNQHQSPFSADVEEANLLEFTVVTRYEGGEKIDLVADQLPSGATFEFISMTEYSDNDGNLIGYEIEGQFKWTPAFGQSQTTPYQAIFSSTTESGTKMAVLTAEITVLPGQQVIAIELNQTSWTIQDMPLGDRDYNYDATGSQPIHKITNTGNVPVMVDIGYVGVIDMIPGLVQGTDTCITGVGLNDEIIPPNSKVVVDQRIEAGEEKPMLLMFGAPTALSGSNNGGSVNYELRAYAVE